jgi:hypothetical protein
MAEQPVTCPDCAGRGHHTVHQYGVFDGRTGGRWIEEECLLCAGFGTVAASLAALRTARLAEGERLQADRKARGLSLRDEARRLGITPMELSDREHGRATPPAGPLGAGRVLRSGGPGKGGLRDG